MNNRPRDVDAALRADTSSMLFKMLWNGLWQRRRLVAILALTGFLSGFALSEVIAPKYTATMQLVPSTTGLEVAPNTSLSGFASTLSGLGMQLPRSSNTSDFILFPQVLTSSEVAKKILTEKAYLKEMFRSEYDPRTDEFRAPPGVGSVAKSVFWGLFGQPGYIPPNVDRIKDFIKKRVTVVQATMTTPVTTLSFTAGDKDFAKKFLQYLYQTTDQQLRDWRMKAAQQNSDYLEKKLNSVSALDYRSALIYQLIPQQMTVMTSNPDSPFSARIIDGPVTGDRPGSPNPVFLMLVGLLLGVIASFGIVAMRVFFPGTAKPEQIVRFFGLEKPLAAGSRVWRRFLEVWR